MPSLVDAQFGHQPTSSSNVSVAVTPVTGDILVVKAATNDSGSATLDTPTHTVGGSFALRASSTSASHCPVWIWTSTISAGGSDTVTVPRLAGSGAYSAVVEVWRNAALAVTPASSAGTGSGAPSGSLVTTQANSAVTWADADWAATSSLGRVYNSASASPVEEFVEDVPTNYVAYYAYQAAASAGTVTFGITTPSTQTWTLTGIEVLDVPVGSGADQNQFGWFPWQ